MPSICLRLITRISKNEYFITAEDDSFRIIKIRNYRIITTQIINCFAFSFDDVAKSTERLNKLYVHESLINALNTHNTTVDFDETIIT